MQGRHCCIVTLGLQHGLRDMGFTQRAWTLDMPAFGWDFVAQKLIKERAGLSVEGTPHLTGSPVLCLPCWTLLTRQVPPRDLFLALVFIFTLIWGTPSMVLVLMNWWNPDSHLQLRPLTLLPKGLFVRFLLSSLMCPDFTTSFIYFGCSGSSLLCPGFL